MIVETLDGQSEMLVDYSGVEINRKVNGEQILTFTLIKTQNNAHSYDLVQNDAIITVEGEEFIIKIVDDSPYSKYCTAINSFFECIDDFVEEQWPDGLYSMQESMEHAFSTSDWSYIIGDSYPQRAKLEEFGNDNAVSMFNKILDAFSSEYEIDTKNKKVTIKRRLSYDSDYQIRYKYNLQAISKTVNSENVKTEVKVFYNLDEFGNYNSSIIYRSPYFNQYPKAKIMSPVYSDVITTESQAISTARLLLNDTPTIELSAEFLSLQQAGFDGSDIELGQGVYLIDERMDIKLSARVIELKTFPYDSSRSPIATISSYKKMITDKMVQQTQQQASIERTAVKQQVIYNGCTITKEDGFKAVAENGVEAFLNATEGIAIKRDGKYKFYASAVENELILDGKLHITNNDITMLEAYMDEAGGLVQIRDVNGLLNVEIGSNKFDSINTGGSLLLYSDGEYADKLRCELAINKSEDAAFISLSDKNANERIIIDASSSSNSKTIIRLRDEERENRTEIFPDEIKINNNKVITEDVLTTKLSELKTEITEDLQDIWDEIGDIWDAIHNLEP